MYRYQINQRLMDMKIGDRIYFRYDTETMKSIQSFSDSHYKTILASLTIDWTIMVHRFATQYHEPDEFRGRA